MLDVHYRRHCYPVLARIAPGLQVWTFLRNLQPDLAP